jgi:subtilisin family serine protease
MALTPLTVLGELIVDALSDTTSATPAEVIERIATRFTPTAEDLATDPKQNRPMWHTRVYLARRHLGDDDRVVAERGRWRLTAPAPPAQPRTPLQPSVIAAPLLDPAVRSRLMGRPVRDDDALPVVIELNVAYKGGVAAAYQAFLALLRSLGLIGEVHRAPELFDDYVPMRMSMSDVQQLVREDAKEPDPMKRVIFRVWPNFPVHPQIDISARTIKADAARRSFDARGRGITWAVIDSGIDSTHPHFTAGHTLDAPDVKDLHRDFTQSLQPGEDTKDAALHDGYGHGTRVASIIAGYLPAKYPKDDVQVISEQVTETDDPNPIPTTRIVAPALLSGMAPDAHLVSLKVLADDGTSNMIAVMAALRYVRTLNGDNDKVTRIHGVNLSLGYEFDPQWFACGQSPLCKEVDRLVRSGVVVVVAAGNTGYARFSSWERSTSAGLIMSINDPGNADRAITVGSTHRGSPHTYGVSFFSSKGPTGDGRLKPDLVAPGERITSATKATPGGPPAAYSDESGTSFAAPHVSGAIAAFLSARPEFITCPDEVKKIFVESAVSLGRERTFEGGGLVDVMRALQSV